MQSTATVQAYFDSSALNQGKIKALIKSLDSYKSLLQTDEKIFYKEDPSMVLGKAADTLLTQEEDFSNLFHVSEIKKPSDNIMAIVNWVLDESKRAFAQESEESLKIMMTKYPDLADHRKWIYDACNEVGYYMNLKKENWENDTRHDKVIKEGTGYWNDLLVALQKQVLSPQEYKTAKAISDSIKNHFASTELLTANSADEEVVYQHIIYFTYKGIECKVMLDHLKFNHTAKTIQPIDIKTMWGSATWFLASLRKFRYDIQAAFYTLALQLAFPDYTVLPFKFIVETTDEDKQGKPCIYTCTSELLSIGRYGRPKMYQHFRPEPFSVITEVVDTEHITYSIPAVPEILGFEQGIDLYLWYSENGFETEKLIIENENQFLINYDEMIFLK